MASRSGSRRSGRGASTWSLLAAVLLSCSCLSVALAQQVILPASEHVYPHPTVWPQPFQLTLNPDVPNAGPTLYVDPDHFDIEWDNNAADRRPLRTQNDGIRQKLFPVSAGDRRDSSLATLTGLQIHVDNPQSAFLIDQSQATSSETYNLSIQTQEDGSNKAYLYAPTAWGAIWGLQTFAQLLTFESGNYLLHNSSVVIYDVPRFQYRGLLLDTSHHFIPVHTFQRVLDGMSFNKLNVLHWMQRSAVATSIQSNVFPELTAAPAHPRPTDSSGGSFDATSAVYTQAQVFELVEYARDRGIHVIIEQGGLEAAAAIGKSHPELLACPQLLEQGYPANQAAAFDPTLDATYAFLRKYWGELDQSSTDLIHLGGDRLNYSACWETNPHLATFMREQKLATFEQLQQYFLVRVWRDILESGIFSNNQSMMYRADAEWRSVFPIDAGFAALTDQVMFQALDHDTLVNITLASFNVLLSGREWDLSSSATQARTPAPPSQGLWDVFDDWASMYLVDPLEGVDPLFELFVVGGQAQMFTFQVDMQGLEAALWPRASAVAERLWSDAPATSAVNAETLFRLQMHVCRMQRLGIRASSLRPGYCSTSVHPPSSSSHSVTVSWVLFGFMIAFSVIGVLYTLSVILSTISHLRAGTKAAVTASLNAPLMER